MGWMKKIRLKLGLKLETMLVESGFGLSGGLVDAEGYPLPDVEKIFEIRSARNELAMLKTDHYEIMKKIEQGLEICFVDTEVEEITSEIEKQTSENNTEQKEEKEESIPKIPPKVGFCKVNQVQFGSPAEAAGMKVGDLVCQYGY